MTALSDDSYRAAVDPGLIRPTRLDWRVRVRCWWAGLGWNAMAIPRTLRADVEPGAHPARPVRGRADWERRL